MTWRKRPAVLRDGDAAGAARNMLDAVSYLIRVASKAGLEGVAAKLCAVRIDLVEATFAPSDPASARDRNATASRRTQRARKTHAAKTH